MDSGTRRVAGQYVRAQARARSWKRFFGGSFKRDYHRWAQGAEGEEVVGEILEGLVEDGWHVIHDVCFGHGNIDHIVDKVPAWRRGVGIVPARMLAGFFARRRPVMSPEQAAGIHRSLAFAVNQAGS